MDATPNVGQIVCLGQDMVSKWFLLENSVGPVESIYLGILKKFMLLCDQSML